jgi:XTP/dITP diphosphohydrolase
MKKIYFVTTNSYKFQKFSEAVNASEIQLEQLSEETPEIQAADNRKIASFSAEWAANKFNLPVVKEDIGLYFNALKGFPGPYLNQIEKWVETDGFINLMKGKEDRSAYWEYAISYCEPGGKPTTFYTHQKGNIAQEARGKGGWYADKVFMPEGQDKTTAELLDEEAYVRNDNHYEQLKEFFTKTFAKA